MWGHVGACGGMWGHAGRVTWEVMCVHHLQFGFQASRLAGAKPAAKLAARAATITRRLSGERSHVLRPSERRERRERARCGSKVEA
eukprot:1188198-Prymnesium_polylepis.1